MYHRLESTDLALNLLQTRILHVNINIQLKFLLSTQLELGSMSLVGCYIAVDSHHASTHAVPLINLESKLSFIRLRDLPVKS